MSRVEEARALASAGYILIPLRGKIPVSAAWPSTQHGAYAPEAFAEQNYGVALGAADLVVDIDPRNFAPGDRPLARLCAAIGCGLDSFTVRTGGGGLHVYFKIPAGTLVRNSLKDFPGIEFKALGRQIVGPGSIHPDSGKEYQVASGSPTKIADAPAGLLALISRAAVPFSELEGTGRYINDAATQGWFADYLQFTAEPSVEGKGGDANAFKVACRGRDLGLPPATTWDLMLEVWNPRCRPAWDAEELKAKVVNAYRYAAGKVGTDHPSAQFSVIDPLEGPVSPATPLPKEEPPAWVTGANGQVIKCFQNLIVYLSHPKLGLAGVFGLNDFTARVEFRKPAPWHKGRMPAGLGVSDNDLKLLKGYLAMRHGFEMPVQNIEEAVTVVAHDNRFHPVREYLGALKWDGKPRLETWLHDYLGVEDSAYTRACARKVLCGAVSRVYRPGVKFDHVLVLEGVQGIGKSSVCRILGGTWGADFPIDPHNKDTVQLMQGKWIVELAELEVTRKADMQALKAFISRTKDEARLAYGRTVGEFPRQSIFIGSINPGADGTYLADDENRRWWPVRCLPHGGQVDFAALKEARDQLFAEAVHRVNKKLEPLYMETEELKTEAREVVGERHADHAWSERISSWLRELDSQPESRREFLTGRDIYVDAMGGIDKQFDRRCQLAIASVLRTLGWVSGHKRVGGDLVRGYVRADKRVPRFLNGHANGNGSHSAFPFIDKKVLDALGDLV